MSDGEQPPHRLVLQVRRFACAHDFAPVEDDEAVGKADGEVEVLLGGATYEREVSLQLP